MSDIDLDTGQAALGSLPSRQSEEWINAIHAVLDCWDIADDEGSGVLDATLRIGLLGDQRDELRTEVDRLQARVAELEAGIADAAGLVDGWNDEARDALRSLLTVNGSDSL